MDWSKVFPELTVIARGLPSMLWWLWNQLKPRKAAQASIVYVLFISSQHATWRKYFLFVPTHPDLKAKKKKSLAPAHLYAGHVRCVLGALYYSGSFVDGVL